MLVATVSSESRGLRLVGAVREAMTRVFELLFWAQSVEKGSKQSTATRSRIGGVGKYTFIGVKVSISAFGKG